MENNSTLFRADRRAKIISIAVLTLLIITVWGMKNLVLLTFLLCFIFYTLLNKVKDFFGSLGIRVIDGVALIFLYLIFILLLVAGCGVFIPIFIDRVTDIVNQIIGFDWAAFNNSLSPRMSKALAALDLSKYITEGTVILTTFVKNLSTNIAGLALDLALSVLLSFLILVEKKKIALFGEYLAKSQIADFYTYFVKFGTNFCATFGKVMKVQVTIAFVNCILSVIAFNIIGLTDIAALAVMIFILGLIPVAGVLISLVPLLAIAFNVGGIVKIIQVLIIIAVLHAVEAYALNPKLMANKTQLPVCFVFSILLVGEHYMGVWGLLIGVPIFIFMMDALGVNYEKAMREKMQNKQRKNGVKKSARKLKGNESRW